GPIRTVAGVVARDVLVGFARPLAAAVTLRDIAPIHTVRGLGPVRAIAAFDLGAIRALAALGVGAVAVAALRFALLAVTAFGLGSVQPVPAFRFRSLPSRGALGPGSRHRRIRLLPSGVAPIPRGARHRHPGPFRADGPVRGACRRRFGS